jgi:hypothetical protein
VNLAQRLYRSRTKIVTLKWSAGSTIFLTERKIKINASSENVIMVPAGFITDYVTVLFVCCMAMILTFDLLND